MTAAIVGWAHLPFGRHAEETVESMIVKVAVDAISDAGLEPKDIGEIYLGHFNAGFSPQDFTASLVLLPFARSLPAGWWRDGRRAQVPAACSPSVGQPS